MDEFNCNFNAPMFVDFEREDLDSNPESYFEVDHEARLEAATAMATEDDDPAMAKSEAIDDEQKVYRSGAKPRADEMATEDDRVNAVDKAPEVEPPKVDAAAEPQREEPERQGRVYKNIVSSWNNLKGTSRPASAASLSRPETPTRKALRQAVAETVAAVTNSPKLNLPMRGVVPKRLQTNTGDQPRLGNATSKPLETASKQQPQKSPGVSRLRKVVNQMTPEVLKNAREARRLKQMAAAEAKNTAAAASNDDNKTVVNASNKFKEQLAHNRRMALAKSVSVPIKGVALPVIKPVHPTNPQPFRFATDSRIKPSAEPKTGDSNNQVDFLKMLRSYKPSSSASSSTSSGPTQVKPFNFAQATASSSLRSRSRSVEPSPSRNNAREAIGGATGGGSTKFVSTAEMMQRFQNGTPDRFRSKPRSRSSSLGIRRRSPSPQLTRAQSPKLMTRERGRSHRTQHILSREQLEELALEEAKKHQFRATAINEGVKPFQPVHVEKRPSTRPEPFNLTEHHARGGATAHPEESNVEFHARPAPKKILEGPVGIPERRQAPLVEPQSPAFALTDRLANRKRQVSSGESESADEDRVFRARAVPHFGVPAILPSSAKKVTTVEPFSFYERDVAMMEKKQQKIAAILDEEQKQRDFKAKPVPDLRKPVNLPMKEVLLPTQPAPFDLQIEKRVGDRHQKWQESVEKQLEEQREAAKFHARPATVLEKEPFVPKQSDKPLSEVSNFELHSDRRAREREEYDQHRKQKESELEGMKRQQEERRLREQEIEIQRLRREAVHKAQPIRQYAQIEVRPSDRPLTEPKSPKFSKLSRERKETENEATANSTFDL